MQGRIFAILPALMLAAAVTPEHLETIIPNDKKDKELEDNRNDYLDYKAGKITKEQYVSRHMVPSDKNRRTTLTQEEKSQAQRENSIKRKLTKRERQAQRRG